jgi:hypothetical protein
MKLKDVISRIALVHGKNLAETIPHVRETIMMLADISVDNPEILQLIGGYGKKRAMKKKNIITAITDKSKR